MPGRLEVTRCRRAHCAPDAVLRLLLGPETWPQWQPEIETAAGPSPLAPGDTVTGRASMLGFAVHGHSTIRAAGPDGVSEEAVVGVRMAIRYELRRDDGGTVVVHRLAADLPRGPLGRVLSLFLRWSLRRMQRRALDELVARAERAEPEERA
ncbi:MAG TPA: SRPBCC family protein [Actinomycetota bacterium]|nr:SRPBCC family protein [Actinomycetota bacterium]